MPRILASERMQTCAGPYFGPTLTGFAPGRLTSTDVRCARIAGYVR